jgi:DNA-nicking Smr family endonuclease
MNRRGGRSRSLSEEERTLWRDVTRSIQPLRAAQEETEIAPEASPARTAISTLPTVVRPSRQPKRVAPLPLAQLGRRAIQRVARGKDAIDGRLDLHGLTQAEAHDVLLRFLQTAQLRKAKLVMVITGKGSRGAEGGVLKRQVPLWLRLPQSRSLVVGFEEAHRTHGGEGALYVRLRRNRGLE